MWNKKLWRCMPHSDAFLHRGTCCCSGHLPGRERPGALRTPHWLIFTVLWYVPQWFRALRTKLKGTGTLDGIPGRDTLHTLYFYIRLHKIVSWLYRIWIDGRVWVCDNGPSYLHVVATSDGGGRGRTQPEHWCQDECDTLGGHPPRAMLWLPTNESGRAHEEHRCQRKQNAD